ncbi:MAG: FKBP-type peptidyl-prolyl cis-trans isomerase [Bacteroidota bacterium]
MKKRNFVIAATVILAALTGCSKAPHTGKANLDNKLDSLSYAMGFFEAHNWKKNFEKVPFDTVDYETVAAAFKNSEIVDSYLEFRRNQFDTIDVDMFKKGFFNELAHDQSYFTEMTADVYIRERFNEQKEKKDSLKKIEGQKNLEEGKAFLEENAKKENVETLENGLQYKIIEEGNGPKPDPSDKIKCTYHGTFIDGTVFDSTEEQGDTATLRINGMIKGWQEALPMMPEGSKWKLFIPPNLAYGPKGAGDDIGPNETVIFEVNLIEIVEEE